MARLRVFGVLAVLTGMGCTESTKTALVVEVSGDFPNGELSEVWVRLGTQGVDGPVRLRCSGHMPFSFEVEARPETEKSVSRISVEAIKTEKLQTKTVAEVNFKHNETLRLDMYLSRACHPTTCDHLTETCGASGACQPLERRPLPVFKSSTLGTTRYCTQVSQQIPSPATDDDAGTDDAGSDAAEQKPDVLDPPLIECSGEGVALECKDPAFSMCMQGKCLRPPELIIPGSSLAQNLVSKPVMQDVLVGLSDNQYLARRNPLNDSGWRNFTIGVSRMPNGEARYSSIFLFDTERWRHTAYRNMSGSSYNTRAAEFADHRIHDLAAHSIGSSLRYHAIWAQEPTPLTVDHAFRDLTLVQLQTKIDELKLVGLFPLRIHGYASGSSALFTAVFTNHNTNADFRVILDRDLSTFAGESNEYAKAGYFASDLSSYESAGAIRFTGVFTKTPGYRGWASPRLTKDEFEIKHAEYLRDDYALNDVEYYSIAPDHEDGRIAASWIRRDKEDFESNIASSALNAEPALNELRSKLESFPGHIGFVVEDLTNSNYLMFRAHDMFYAAGLFDVLVAAKVLQAVDAGALKLNQVLPVTPEDILTEQDELNTDGNQRLIDLLKRMLGSRSLNARERLLRQVTPELVDKMLQERAENVGPFLDTCRTDKLRLGLRHECVNSIACHHLENWIRDGRRASDNELSEICLGAIELVQQNDPARIEIEYAKLHAAYTNSITPLEYAKLFRYAFTTALSSHNRDLLVGLLARPSEDLAAIGSEPFYGRLSALPDTDHRVLNYAGIGYDLDAKLHTLSAQFAFSAFTENWPNSPVDREAAQALIQDALRLAQAVLHAQRR